MFEITVISAPDPDPDPPGSVIWSKGSGFRSEINLLGSDPDPHPDPLFTENMEISFENENSSISHIKTLYKIKQSFTLFVLYNKQKVTNFFSSWVVLGRTQIGNRIRICISESKITDFQSEDTDLDP